jgi:hypothetical protein
LSTDDSYDVVSCFERCLRRSTDFDFFKGSRNGFRRIDFDRRDWSGRMGRRSDGRTGRKEERSDVVAEESTERLRESSENESQEVTRVETVPAVRDIPSV